MNESLLILVVLIAVGFVALYFAIQKLLVKTQQAQLESVVDEVFGKSAAKVAEQSKQILEGEKDIIKTDLANKQQVFEKLVKQLQDSMKIQQDEIRNLEKDRTLTFSQLKTSLEDQKQQTEALKTSTQSLEKILSNNQTRGEWGERIIEDLMQANGLMEGTQYVRQVFLRGTNLKPDISLLLPNSRKVAVDVKFPYQEIQKMAMTDSKSQKEVHLKQFRQDMKIKIDKVAQYINPEADTLDYAIMFVPNEMIFSFINQKFPDLIDDALSKRVIMVSPFSFLIVARTVMESYRNFMIGDTLKEIVNYVDEFVGEWGKFKGQFEKYGRSLSTLQTDYEAITGTRVRQMDRRIEKIQSYQAGSLLPAGEGDGESTII
jgi:DNA recombination protein RmuC